MATWKKVIVSGSNAILNQLNVSTNQQIGTTQAATFLTGSFNGSFTGDGSGLTGVGAGTVESISTGTGLTGGPITTTGTIDIDTSVVATLTGVQTLSGKTLTQPVIGGGGATFNGSTSGTTKLKATAVAGTTYLTLPAAIDTLVGKATADTLTNKTINGTNNTITNVSLTTAVSGILPVANGGTGVNTKTGTGAVVLSTSPTLTSPNLGTPTTLVGTNITGTATNFTASTVTTNANFTAGPVTSTGNTTAIANGAIANTMLANNQLTVGTTAISLGGTSTTLAGLTSVTSAGFTGNITGNVTGNVTGDVVGNAATATKATSITATANNSTNETTYLTFVDGATGSQGIETDTDLTYNPSTNILTAVAFAGALTGNVAGNVTGNVTGNVVGNVTGNVVGNATGLSGTPAITVGTVSATTGSFSGDLTVDGDLVVNGDLVTLNTANLAVEDRFILLNSGSSAANEESGIIFGGANGTANSGTALIWKGGYQDASSNPDGRLAIANTVAADDTAATPSYYIAGVYEGSAANAATAQADHIGNIRIENNEIFIFA